MDPDFWTSRLAVAKRQLNQQYHQGHGSSSHHNHLSSQFDRSNIDNIEVEDETRSDFPCPYCYEDFDITSLCFHLEDEHSSESIVTGSRFSRCIHSFLQVCPICSVKVSRDMLSHITLQHGHLFKIPRRHRLRRVAVPSSQALSLLGRDLCEAHLEVLLGGNGYRTNSASGSNTVPADPLLSSLVLKFPTSEVEEISKSVVSSVEDSSATTTSSPKAWKSRFDPSLSYEERQKRMRQAAGRAVFVQDLFVSTLFAE